MKKFLGSILTVLLISSPFTANAMWHNTSQHRLDPTSIDADEAFARHLQEQEDEGFASDMQKQWQGDEAFARHLQEQEDEGSAGDMQKQWQGGAASAASGASVPEFHDHELALPILTIGQTALSKMAMLLANPKTKPIATAYQNIMIHLGTITQDADVHSLDQYVTDHFAELIAFGKLFELDNGNLSFNKVKDSIRDFISANPDFYTQYNGQTVPKEELSALLEDHSFNDITTDSMRESVRETWSRGWTLALRLYNEEGKRKAIIHMLDAVVENKKTGGGCLPGRINRAFVAYALILGELVLER